MERYGRLIAQSGSALRDDTRRQLAEHYLAESKHSIPEVAFLLGLRQHNSFTRVANRWFTMSPKECRKTLYLTGT